MNHRDIINRLKELTGKNEDQELASILGLKKANFSARKQRDSLIDVITEWGIKEDADLNYLLKGNMQKEVSIEFLKDIEQWMKQKLVKDERFQTWFEVQFENTFQDFKKWKEEKEEKEENKSSPPIQKVA